MIKYTLNSLLRNDLDDKILEYISKMGHPESIYYDRELRNGHHIAILTYKDDLKNVKTIYNNSEVIEKQLTETNTNFKKLIASINKLERAIKEQTQYTKFLKDV